MKKGFTLIELLIVAVIFSILGVGIMTSFVSGVKLWRRSEDMARNFSGVFFALEKISQELHYSVELPAIGFEGKTEKSGESIIYQEFSFSSAVNDSLVKLVYKFDPDKKILIRGQVALNDLMLEKESEKYTEKEVLSLEEFRINYLCFDSEAKAYSWKDSWEKKDGIFPLIKLNGKYNGKEFSKIIFIPIA